MTTQTLSYEELAAKLSITPDSARKLARRRRWARKVGNDGKTRVEVPVDRLDADSDVPRDSPRVIPPDSPPDVLPPVPPDETALVIARLEVEVAGLKALVAAERGRADAAVADRDRWHAMAVRPWWKRLAG